MRKIYFLLTLSAALLHSCFTNGTTTVTEEKVQLIQQNQNFTIDSIDCSVYEASEHYTRIFTSNVLDSCGIIRVTDTLAHLIPPKASVYFHINPIGDRGAEYATLLSKSYIIFADKVIRNQTDLSVLNIETHLDYINSVPANSETIFPTISIILKDLKDSDDRMGKLTDTDLVKSKDFKKLQERLKATKRKYYPVMRKAFYEQAKQRMWEVDIDVILRGSQIYFYGYEYALNRNIQGSYENMSQSALDLRFTRVAFGTYNGGEYTYYTPFKGKDTD